MDNLFNTILASTSNDITVSGALITILVSAVLGGMIAFTYYKTQDEEVYQQNFAVTLMMLPIILSVIIIFVGSNIARAFSLAGTLSIIRFRSAPGDAKDIGFIFFAIAAGLACGVGLYGYGIMFVILLGMILFILKFTGIFKKKDVRKILKITIPEDLNYDGVFDEILKKYTKNYELSKIKTTDLGSLFEISYNVTMEKSVSEQEFLNELRVRNGNLSIMLTLAPNLVK